MLFNGGLGIDASGPAVQLQIIDEGDNIARGNAEPQCVGVLCVPH